MSIYKKIMVVWVLASMTQIQASSSEKEFAVNDLEEYQILKIRFTSKKPIFNKLETTDTVAELWSRDSNSVNPVSWELFHKRSATESFVFHNQKVMTDGLTASLEMMAPKYIFNENCFVEETIKLVLCNSVVKSPCSRIIIEAKDTLRPIQLKGGINFDPNPALDESQYTDFPSFFKNLTGGTLLYKPKNLFDSSSTLWLTNAKVKIFYNHTLADLSS